MSVSLVVIGSLFANAILAVDSATVNKFERISPFDEAKVSCRQLQVRIGSSWYECSKINSIPTSRLIQCAKKYYAEDWAKELVERLPMLFSEMGNPINSPLFRLELKSSNQRTLAVNLLGDKRKRNYIRDHWESVSDIACRFKRIYSKRIVPRYEYLNTRYENGLTNWNTLLSRSEIFSDLEQLEYLLRKYFSYLKLREFSYSLALDSIRNSVPKEGLSKSAFAVQLEKFIALFGDGHAGVEHQLARVYLPFLVSKAKEGWIAYHPDRKQFLEREFPILVAIDDLPLERWLEVARRFTTKGSSALIERRSAEVLRYIHYMRFELGLPQKHIVSVTLQSRSGRRKRKLLRVSLKKPKFGKWPRENYAPKLVPKITYLRIGRMEDHEESVNRVKDFLERAKKSKGVVIDLRGNTGGSRDMLKLIFPHTMAPNEEPYVANLAKYKIGLKGECPIPKNGYLTNRSLFPRAYSGWSIADRNSIDRFMKTFQPTWNPHPPFSVWHFFLIRSAPNPKLYGKKIALLTNTANFSATDIFVSAFKGRPNVRVFGMPTSGGSARRATYQLQNSKIRVNLGTIASFQKTGHPYDGVGVIPDVINKPEATFLIGRTDETLAKSIAWIQSL